MGGLGRFAGGDRVRQLGRLVGSQRAPEMADRRDAGGAAGVELVTVRRQPLLLGHTGSAAATAAVADRRPGGSATRLIHGDDGSRAANRRLP